MKIRVTFFVYMLMQLSDHSETKNFVLESPRLQIINNVGRDAKCFASLDMKDIRVN